MLLGQLIWACRTFSLGRLSRRKCNASSAGITQPTSQCSILDVPHARGKADSAQRPVLNAGFPSLQLQLPVVDALVRVIAGQRESRRPGPGLRRPAPRLQALGKQPGGRKAWREEGGRASRRAMGRWRDLGTASKGVARGAGRRAALYRTSVRTPRRRPTSSSPPRVAAPA